MNSRSVQKSKVGRVGIAAVAAMIACAGWCALPLLLPLVGAGAAAGLARWFGPGAELFVGSGVFVSVLVVMALRSRARRRRALQRGEAGCCGADALQEAR